MQIPIGPTLWELIKGTIPNETIKYATYKKNEEWKNEEKLISDIELLENKIIQKVATVEDLTNKLDEKRRFLENTLNLKFSGLMITAKALRHVYDFYNKMLKRKWYIS